MSAFEIFCWSVLAADVLLGIYYVTDHIVAERHLDRLFREGKLR